MHPNIHCSTIYYSQKMETTKMSVNRGTDKANVVRIHNGMLLSHKKEQHWAICRGMDGPRDRMK